jgi:hypothetical protein
MAMAWLILNPDTAALFVRRSLQAALDKEPKAKVIRTEVNVLLYETPQAQPFVDVTVNVPEQETAWSLLAYLRAGNGVFERRETRPGKYCIATSLGRNASLKIDLLDDGLLHIDVEPRADFTM